MAEPRADDGTTITANGASRDLEDFLTRWEASGAAERANYAPFLSELCDVLGVPRPDPTRPDDAENAYVFERAVTFRNPDGSTSVGRIDLYKRGCFVLEAKQGSDRTEQPTQEGALALPKRPRRRGTAVRGTAGWDEAMLAAKGQADQYVRALPASEPNPPFLVVVDVGHTIELYADFTRQGRTYVPFPDARTHRIRLRDLARDEIRARLRSVWTEPTALDPSRRTAQVTREVAAQLATLAQSLERSGQAPEAVAHFLMRCLFTFFAEDVGLLPRDGFTAMLRDLRDRREVALFPDMARSLWETMKTGGFSPILRAQVLRFNGGLFESPEALPLTLEQLALMVRAGEKGWREVEPAIFGTLLERALDPVERHKLGAHYTPRAYVERLVMPTIIEPLRDEWANVQAAAVTLAAEDKLPEAREEVWTFLRRLCDVTILDPACGTGNFLYVTLEHLKRLEGEVWDALRGLGESQAAFEGFGLTVDPHQLRGIEINPRAAAIADLVLWIGYLQWHFRTLGDRMPAEPIIHAYQNIECRDAVLEYDGTEPLTDENGQPVTRWDGRTMKRHPVTGEDVPDESAQVPVLRYRNPRKAEWPQADYVVGNPPFVGAGPLRQALGDGYAEALRKTHDDVPESSDFVVYWWNQAAYLARRGAIRRFGFIATNSLRQTFNRRVLQAHLSAKSNPLSIVFAIPDHPWVDTADGAAVRISMTVGERGTHGGILQRVVSERPTGSGEHEVELKSATGTIFADLTIGADVVSCVGLRANERLSCPGVKLHGSGFIVTPEEAESLGLGRIPGLEQHIREYVNGKDLNQRSRKVMVIDLLGLTSDEVRERYPAAYQWILERVKPERDTKARGGTSDSKMYAKLWWLFGKTRGELRIALAGLSRFIVTTETSKHRFFVFLDASTLPDNKLITIALEDACFLGVLSSRLHVVWALASGSWLGAGNDPVYVKSRCFEGFPFPDCDEDQKASIRRLAESLDAHRKRQQALHPTLTLTGMYNVLAKLRSGEPLTDKEKVIHEQGLVSVLKQIHDDLDAAVFDAYGWPGDLADEEILRRLVELNRERAVEEARGVVRWLRPEFQAPESQRAAVQTTLPIAPDDDDAPPNEPAATTAATPAKKSPWPKTLPEQAHALRAALAAHPAGLTADALARLFQRAPRARVTELLETLVSLGQARELPDGRFVRS